MHLKSQTGAVRIGRFWPVLAPVIAIGLLLSLNGGQSSAGPLDSLGFQATAEVTPDGLLAESLAEKEEIDRRYRAAVSQPQAAPPPRAHPIPQDLRPIEDPPFVRGILEGVSGPFSSQDVVVVNLWQDETETGFIQVFAGAYGAIPDQGVLVVLETSRDRLHTVESRYPAPAPQGALGIVAAEGAELTLRSADGSSLTFDLEIREYSVPG